MYIYKKGSIVGPAWKAPFIGPFLDSVRPDFTKYHAKWASGPLSCVSVFHKYGNFTIAIACYSCNPILTAAQIRRHCLHS